MLITKLNFKLDCIKKEKLSWIKLGRLPQEELSRIELN